MGQFFLTENSLKIITSQIIPQKLNTYGPLIPAQDISLTNSQKHFDI